MCKSFRPTELVKLSWIVPKGKNEAVYQSNIQLVLIRTVAFPLMLTLAGLAQLAVLFYGGQEVMAGRLSIGDILAFNVYLALMTFPLTAIGILLNRLATS